MHARSKLLLVPSSDYVGHPFPQRYNQIFERINDHQEYELHVLNFNIFGEKRIKTNAKIHEIDDVSSKNLISFYIINSLKYAVYLRNLIEIEKIDILVFSNFTVPIIYLLIDLFNPKNIPIVFDVPDYYPTSASGYFCDVESKIGRFVTGFFEILFRFLLKNSDAISVVSQGLKRYSEAIGLDNIYYITNGISEHFYEKKDGSKIRKYLNISEDEFLVGYIGSVEFWCDFKPLIEGVKLASEEGINIKLLIVGKNLHTNYDKYVEKIIKENNIESLVLWLDFIPYSEVPYYMSALDVGTIPFNINNPTAYYSAPNKMWEYASQLVSIISTPIPEAVSNRDILFLVQKSEDYLRSFKEILKKSKKNIDKKNLAKKRSNNRTWNQSSNSMILLINDLMERKNENTRNK